MDFQQIRQTFDLGSIILTNGKLSVFYSRSGLGYTHQVISNNTDYKEFKGSKRVFEALLQNADCFSIHLYGDYKFRLDFEISGFSEKEYLVFLPLSYRPTEEEERSFMEQIYASEEVKEGVRFIADYNPQSYEELMYAVSEWESYKYGDGESQTIYNIDSDLQDRWENMLDVARDFYDLLRLGFIEIDEPSLGDPGAVEFQIETRSHIGYCMTGEKKDRFLDLVRACDTVRFEAVNNNNGPTTYGNITFYS